MNRIYTMGTAGGLVPHADLAVCSKSSNATNQDVGGLYQGRYLSAIAVADGLGSSFDAHIASRLAVKIFLTEVKERDTLSTTIDIGVI